MAVSKKALVLALALASSACLAQYKPAPGAIQKILSEPATPGFSLSPAKDRYILTHRKSYPSIEEVSQPYVGLAGGRFNLATSGPHMLGRNTSFTVHKIEGGTPVRVQTPVRTGLGGVSWSDDGRFIAYTSTGSGPGELGLADTN